MGAEVTIELLRRLEEQHIAVDHCFLDGAPCIKLSPLYKKVMYLKFKTMTGIIKKKGVDYILNGKMIKKFSNGDTESLRPMLEALATTASILTKESIKNETECCNPFVNDSFFGAIPPLYAFRDGEMIIGTSGMSFVEKPPYFGCPSGKMGLLSSMFTNPNYRRKGIAKELLSRVVKDAREYGCGTIQITASDMGVKLYTAFGFVHNGNFMQYKL